MPGIFINYRRDDAPGVAGRLYDYLARTFSRRELFIDVDAIKPGLDFVKQLDSQVSQCDLMLALIGPHWATANDEQGRRRLDGDKDYVRIEIASALRRDIPVIPVLIDGARMPAEEDLPDDLKSLARRHALELRHTRFASDAGDIAEALAESLPKRKRRWPWAVAAAAACLIALPVVWALYVWEGPQPPEPKTASVTVPEPRPPEPKADAPEPTPPEPKTAAAAPPPSPVPVPPAPTSGLPPPDRIVLAGAEQTADLRRVGKDSWEWMEKGSVFTFSTAAETEDELTIHDPSRDMYHRLNLQNGETFWRVGTSGNWTPHYRISSMTRPPPTPQIFTDPMVGTLPLDGCLYYARECGEPAASAWCASKGLGKAASFEGYRNVPQTQVLGDGKVCTAGPSGVCGTFTAIACSGG